MIALASTKKETAAPTGAAVGLFRLFFCADKSDGGGNDGDAFVGDAADGKDEDIINEDKRAGADDAGAQEILLAEGEKIGIDDERDGDEEGVPALPREGAKDNKRRREEGCE